MKKVISVLIAIFMIFSFAACTKTPVDEEKPSEADVSGLAGGNPVASITVAGYGTMKIELYPDVAPNTVKNFIALAQSGFYDGLTFHRIYKNFMIQGGCPQGNGMGDPGYSIKGEFSSNGFDNDLAHTRGVISMARSQMPDSAGSQFFIMHQDAPQLDGKYAAFGMVIEGLDVLDAIAESEVTFNAGSGEMSNPVKPVIIESVTVETFGISYGEPETIE